MHIVELTMLVMLEHLLLMLEPLLLLLEPLLFFGYPIDYMFYLPVLTMTSLSKDIFKSTLEAIAPRCSLIPVSSAIQSAGPVDNRVS